MSTEWRSVPLGEILKPISRPEAVIADKTYRILGAHWYAHGLYTKDTKPGSSIQAQYAYRVEEGDFVYNRLFAWKGSFAIASAENAGCYVSNEFPCFKVNNARIDSGYLRYYFSRESAWNEALGLSSGGTPTSRNRLKEERLLAMQMNLPPLNEQRRIVARIEELAAKVEEARRLRADATDAVSALSEAGISIAFDMLSHCPTRRLSTLASKIGSGSTPTGGRAAYPSSGTPFIRSLNVRMRYFTSKDLVFIGTDTHHKMRGTTVYPNDVLLNITGASIGRVACAPGNFQEANVNQHVAIIRPTKELLPRFLMYWLSQTTTQEAISNDQKGATRQGFTKAQIEAFQVPLPSLDEQAGIVTYLDGLQARVNALNALQQQSSTGLDALMPSVLDKAFRGDM